MNGQNSQNQNTTNNLNNNVGIDPTSLGSPLPMSDFSNTTQSTMPNEMNVPQGFNNVQPQPIPQPMPNQTQQVLNPNPVPTPNIVDNSQMNIQPQPLNNQVNQMGFNQNNNLTGMDQNGINNVQTVNNMAPIEQPIPGTMSNVTGTNPAGNVNSNAFVEPNKVENIGTVPPPKNKEKKGLNKIVFVIIIIVLMAAVAFGVYYYLTIAQSKKIVVTPKTVTVNLNDTLSNDAADYATITGVDSKSCVVSKNDADTKKVGKYTYTITCGKETFTGNIFVVDNEKPSIVTKEVVVKANTEVSVEDFVESCSKDKCTYEFVEEVDTSVAGEYTVEINVKDSSNNENVAEAALIVISEDTSVMLECISPEEDIDNATKVVKNLFGINNSNQYTGYARQSITYTYEDEEYYKEAIGEKESEITIDGVTGKAIYNDEELTVTIDKTLSEEDLQTEFQGTMPTTYIEIRVHYTNLNYTINIIDFK